MKRDISLRRMTAADLPFADSLRNLAGWNQTMQDWARLLALSPEGCFIAEWNGTAAGTATTICYGQELGWIGMLLVHPDFRRRGIGRSLLDRCLEYLRGCDVGCIKLDATSEGKLLYDRLGFQEEWPLTRWECHHFQRPTSVAGTEVRPYTNADAEPVEQLDRKAFGAPRPELSQSLFAGECERLVHQTNRGITGYVTLREGARALYLGPLVASSSSSGDLLINTLLFRATGNAIFWDIPDANAAAVAFAQELGFTAQRHLVRMFLGPNKCPGTPQHCFAIADPAVG